MRSAQQAASNPPFGRGPRASDPVVELTDDAHEYDRRADRQRRATSRQIDAETATLVGMLMDIGESGSLVAVTTSAGSTIVSQIVALSDEVVAFASAAPTYVRVRAITMVERLDGPRPPGGERQPELTTMASVLFDLAPLRPDVVLTIGSATTIGGRLDGCGADVCHLTVTVDGSPRRKIAVAIDHINTLKVLNV